MKTGESRPESSLGAWIHPPRALCASVSLLILVTNRITTRSYTINAL
jgi:hypothetical protein